MLCMLPEVNTKIVWIHYDQPQAAFPTPALTVSGIFSLVPSGSWSRKSPVVSVLSPGRRMFTYFARLRGSSHACATSLETSKLLHQYVSSNPNHHDACSRMAITPLWRRDQRDIFIFGRHVSISWQSTWQPTGNAHWHVVIDIFPKLLLNRE